MKRAHWIALIFLGLLAAVAGMEFVCDRSIFGPDGHFGFWTSNIWGPECSQRIADAYSFSHLGHGLIFYGFLWLVARRLPVGTRFLLAVMIEGGWELLENSPLIINRYRAATMALGYEGDSILNSVSDILMMSLGFLFAWRTPVWASIVLFAAMEIACALWIHDNLILNVIMLVHPIAAIKAWQMSIAPH